MPILLEARGLDVLVVGGGPVAARKAAQLASAGAQVRVVAPRLCEAMDALALERGLAVERRAYERGDIADAQLVFAATDDAAVNARIAEDCASAHRLLNAADHAGNGDFAMMAVHHRGPLTIGVSAGGVPAAATRIRDALAERFDARYGDALAALGALRARLLREGRADAWRTCSTAVIDADFCDDVENGRVDERVAPWR